MPQVADLKEVRAQTQGFAGGVNIQEAANLLQPIELRKGENIVLDERGAASKRPGCQSQGTFGVAADRIISSYRFDRGINPPQFLIHTSAGQIYYTLDPTANPAVWTLISGGYSTTQPMSWETFNSKVYFCDGVSNYSAWDGAALTTFPSAPKAKYLRIWKDTMWSSGISGTPDRVFSSAPGDPETWPAASWVDIRKGDGDAVGALGTDGLFLIVGKRNTVQVIYDPALFSNRTADYEKGIESHWSIIQFEANIFFLSRRGVCKYNGDQPADIISYKIDPLFDPRVLNYGALNLVWAYSVGDKISWCVPEVGNASPTMQINYYPRLAELSPLGVRGLGPWSFDRIPIRVATLWRSGAVIRLFGGSNIANKLYWVFADNVGQDDGVSFAGLLETGLYDLGDPIVEKYIRRIRVLGRGKFTLQLKKNAGTGVYKSFPVDLTSGGTTWNIGNWNVGNWGPDSNLKETTVNPDAYGRFFSIVITDAEPGAGTVTLPVGSKDYSIPQGEWSVLGLILDGSLLGVRT